MAEQVDLFYEFSLVNRIDDHSIVRQETTLLTVAGRESGGHLIVVGTCFRKPEIVLETEVIQDEKKLAS